MRRFLKKIFAGLSSKKISVLAELTLPYIENGEKVLDFGCGTGLIAKYICDRKKVKMKLLDITDKRNETNLKIKVYDGKKAPYKDSSFDNREYLGWLELNNGFFFFIDKEMWENTCSLFNMESKK